MATRYSGDCTIVVTWLDSEDQYRASVTWPDGDKRRRVTHRIKAPAHPTRAVDSPEAFDTTAHAALSFSPAPAQDSADLSPTGWLISRRPLSPREAMARVSRSR